MFSHFSFHSLRFCSCPTPAPSCDFLCMLSSQSYGGATFVSYRREKKRRKGNKDVVHGSHCREKHRNNLLLLLKIMCLLTCSAVDQQSNAIVASWFDRVFLMSRVSFLIFLGLNSDSGKIILTIGWMVKKGKKGRILLVYDMLAKLAGCCCQARLIRSICIIDDFHSESCQKKIK